MKKTITLLLALVLCLSLCACSNSNAELENETLELLDKSYSYCHTGILYMLRAWDFSIKHSSDSTREEYEALWNEFGAQMGMTEDDMVDALIGGCGFTIEDLSKAKDPSRGLNTTIDGMLFMDASYSVPTARYAFEQRNEGIDNVGRLEQIKESLKTIGEKSKSYDLLKEYYLLVSEMQNWIQSPNGSYSSSSSSLTDYEKKSESIKQELDLIIN
mgnify:FL=1